MKINYPVFCQQIEDLIQRKDWIRLHESGDLLVLKDFVMACLSQKSKGSFLESIPFQLRGVLEVLNVEKESEKYFELIQFSETLLRILDDQIPRSLESNLLLKSTISNESFEISDYLTSILMWFSVYDAAVFIMSALNYTGSERWPILQQTMTNYLLDVFFVCMSFRPSIGSDRRLYLPAYFTTDNSVFFERLLIDTKTFQPLTIGNGILFHG